jgi:hypothetical protein
MTRDDILRMAREAQWFGGIEGWTFNSYAELARFAALAYEAGAAAEREACAKVCESVIEEIRETADNVLSHEDCRSIQAAQDCAAAIRARGQPDPKVTHLNAWARDRLARHGIPEPDEGNPSFG